MQSNSVNKQNGNSLEILNDRDSILNNSSRLERVLDSKILLDSIASNPYDEKDLKYYRNLKEEEGAKILLCSSIFFLNDKKITKISNLEIYHNLSELYLQRNFIKKIEGLEQLFNLKILSLNNNYIVNVEGLKILSSLRILDLGDNIIEELHMEEFPTSISYLYLFDNIFYDTISLFDFRAKCIKKFPDLTRLDGLDVSNIERMILTEEDVAEMDTYLVLKLKHVKDYYDNMRRIRREILKHDEFLFNLDSNKEELSLFVTDEFESGNLNLDKIKEEISSRKRDFETDSSARMSNLKHKLNNILEKVRDNPIIDEDRRNRIVGRINKAIKFDQKKETAENILRGMTANFEKISEGINVDILENDSDVDEEYVSSGLICLDNSEKNQIEKKTSGINYFLNKDIKQTKNMLLTDMSDLSFLEKTE